MAERNQQFPEDKFFFEAIGASDPSPTLDTTREDREWTTENQGAAQHFRQAARDFQMPHGIFGSNSGFANRARHLPEAARHLEKRSEERRVGKECSTGR